MGTPEPASRPRDSVRRRLRDAMLRLLAALPTLAPLAFAPPVAAQETPMTAPDFSSVTTRAAAQRPVRAGRLVRIALFPTELGAPDNPANIGYITPEAADACDKAIDTLVRPAEQG